MTANQVADTGFYTPSVITKQLKMNEANGRRKVRISSNFIRQMGFEAGQRITAVPSIAGGFDVRPSNDGEHQVHTRTYNRARGNNPLESLVEFSSKKLINSTFPPSTERFHVKMKNGEIQVRPVPNRVFNISKRFKGHDPYRALLAMTGGVDVHCLDRAGFKSEVVIEYRPQEARDLKSGRNLEEVHALNTLRNGQPSILINEDIFQIDVARLKAMCDGLSPIAVGHFSIQCDSFSSANSNSQRQKSLDDGSTSVDMVYPVLRNIEEMEYAVVIIENVRGFQNHDAGGIMLSMLRRMGYHTTEVVANALDHGGIQGRTRYYMVASIFPGFEAPEMEARNQDSIWPIVEKHLEDCRDVTDTNFIRQRESSGRGGALITKDSTCSPTFIKSQNRGIKDGVYIGHEGRILAPSEGLIQELMSIPSDFDVSWMAREQAIETLGQSIDYKLHHKVASAVHEHIKINLGETPMCKRKNQSDMFAQM